MSRIITGPLEYPDCTQLPRGLLRIISRSDAAIGAYTIIASQYSADTYEAAP